jgi:hypothetical protein
MSGIEPPQNTFIVRFWWELPKGEPPHTRRWRGRIEHLQSGEVAAFCDVAQILVFIKNFVPTIDATQMDGKEDERTT